MENKWKFKKTSSVKGRVPLTAQEVSYWKKNLAKILKLGVELEFNLVEKKNGTCKGTSYTCPCIHYGKFDRQCWSTCTLEPQCSTKPEKSKCANADKTVCNSKCSTCNHFHFKCLKLNCSSFTSACFNCDEFVINCNNCNYLFDPNKNPNAIREACRAELAPSGSYGVVSKSGVHNIVTDGSLLGDKGCEIVTTGRRIDYYEFHKMIKNIIDQAVKRGAYVNERCSIHMHVLASYYGKVPGSSSLKINEMERSMPEIILANLHQLLRRYQNAITWMTTGLDNPERLTRWEKFRVSVLPFSPVSKHMIQIRDSIIDAAGGSKYGWVNYKFCEFDTDNNDVSRLHTEIRVMDGILAPSAVAAVACMYYALFIKAVEISRYGLLDIDSDNWIERATEIKNAILNNNSTWEEGNATGRFSNTKDLFKYTKTLVADSFELLVQLKHILTSVGPAYEILEKLAEAPCSIRRCDGKTWEQIEEALAIELTEEGLFEYTFKKIIDTRELTEESNIEMWLFKVAKLLQQDKEVNNLNESFEDIHRHVVKLFEEKQSNGEVIWSPKIGSAILI